MQPTHKATLASYDSGAERRRHPRRPLLQDVHCYIDGARLDGSCLNVSAGGLFLKTDVQRDIAPGASVGLVFKAQPHSQSPVILFGQVARQQLAGDEGLGIAWAKAVTPGEPGELVAVLRQVLGIEPEGVHRVVDEDGQARSVYLFASSPPTEGEPAGFVERPEEAGWPRSLGPGAISRQFDRRFAGTPLDEPALLMTEGRERIGRLRRLGMTGLALTLQEEPALAFGAEVEIRVEIRTNVGVIPIALRCRMLGPEVADPEPEDRPSRPSDRTSLAFEIVARDEGDHAGIVDRYLKWLHLSSMFQS